jgi:hypothetical protein
MGMIADHFLDLDLLRLIYECLHDRRDELLHNCPSPSPAELVKWWTIAPSRNLPPRA